MHQPTRSIRAAILVCLAATSLGLSACDLGTSAKSPQSSGPSKPVPNLTIEQVRNLTFVWEGDTKVTLHNGSARVSDGGSGVEEYTLLDNYAVGDVNGDGRPDAAVVVVDQSVGSGVFSDLVVVLNTEHGPVALKPALIGDRVPIQRLAITGSTVRVSYLNRTEDAAMTEVNEMVQESWSVSGNELKQVGHVVQPLTTVPLPTPNPTPISLAGVGSGAKAVVNLKADTTQTYTFTAKAGDRLEASLLNPPLGVFVAVHQGSHYLTASTSRSTTWSGVLPSAGEWSVDVANLGADVSNVALTVRTSGPQPARVATPRAPSSTPPRGKVAYLTFDDGPNPPYTQQVLALLKKYHAHATFFVVGANAQRFSALIDQERAAGDLIGNHTWDHASLAGMSKRGFDAEVLPTKRILGSRGSNYLRPPYGAINPYTARYAADDGYHLQLWDIDPRDWARPGVASIVNNVLSHLYPRAVILMHDGGGNRSQSVAALEQILSRLTAQGWRFIPLDGNQR